MRRLILGVFTSLTLSPAGASGAPHTSGQDWKYGVRSLIRHRAGAGHAASASRGGVHAGRGYPGSPYSIEYLLARRAKAPARFDHYHPILGPLLERDARLRA